jgi:uncharacterized protein YndB with AHSA1/START domain
MPLRIHPDGTRALEMALVVPGTPEQVWHALATGPGNTAWFTTATIEEREGGALVFDMGPSGVSRGTVTTWQPPSRFGYVEAEWAEGAPPIATEITIEGRDNGTCVVRMVHSLFTSSDAWDDQVEGFESGWPGFFALLKLYLTHFVGQPAGMFVHRTTRSTPQAQAWSSLLERLGLHDARAEDTRTAPGGPEHAPLTLLELRERATERDAILRVHGDASGLLAIGTYDAGDATGIAVCRYVYGEGAGARARALDAAWSSWLAASA